MEQCDIAIIGGGAAGLFAAATAAAEADSRKEPFRIVLLEKMGRCGRKIGLTGKGRCNLTNTKSWEEFSGHIHPNNLFFKSAFFGMDNRQTMAFFEKIGLPLVVERGDRVYPQSMRACDVTDVLSDFIKKRGVRVLTNTSVGAIRHSVSPHSRIAGTALSGDDWAGPGTGSGESGGSRGAFCRSESEGPEKDNFFLFRERTSEAFLAARRVILATGGLSYPATGSTGDGYRMAEGLGHTVTECFPSLTALVPQGYNRDFHGISLKNVSVELQINGCGVAAEFGDLDFTGGGIEGPIGFRVSRKAVESLLQGQRVVLVLDLKPALSAEQLEKRIHRELEERNRISGREKSELGGLLNTLLPKSLIPLFVRMHPDLSAAKLPQMLKKWAFPIVSYVGYDRCVVTAGGVALSEVSRKSMESKLISGLYFAGEVLDLDGDTGGYNLQIAFSTAASAARSALKSLR